MPRLDGRPLIGVFDERPLFVEPPHMMRLTASLSRGLNVAILGVPGSGKTTLLRTLAADEPDAERPRTYVDLSPARTAREALGLIAEALGQRPPATAFSETLQRVARPPATESSYLIDAVRRLSDAPPAVVLADSPPGRGETYALFGRLRDELWVTGHQWVVAMDNAQRDEITRPPASAFFEVTVELEGLDRPAQRALLERRVAGDPALQQLVALVPDDSLRTPRAVLQLAREAALSGRGIGEVLDKRAEMQRRLLSLPESARLVAQHLQAHGATSPSDPELLTGTGLSQQRLRQLLRELEQAGLARSYSEQRERRGRPRKLYELVDELPEVTHA